MCKTISFFSKYEYQQTTDMYWQICEELKVTHMLKPSYVSTLRLKPCFRVPTNMFLEEERSTV
jgi:hypothetical protein